VTARPGNSSDAAPRGYRILFELGRGGMGAAFLAKAEGAGGFERLVVVKRIRPERAEDPKSVERFLREARVAAAIHHANVVGTQHVEVDEQGPFIVLDYVDGASLEDLLDHSLLKQQTLPVPIVLRIALDALAGLEAVHGASNAQGKRLNVLHRDVSLQNILVGRDGVTRLLDFGIARSDLGGASTDQRYLVGKLPYLPPEYLRREPLAETADIYGLGVTLWFALSGAQLWPDASEAQVLRHILEDGVPSLASEVAVAPEIVALVDRAVCPMPTARFQSARDMAAVIESFDRERGWLANHREVADWLADLVGTDLDRRRDRAAQLLATTASKPDQRPQSSRTRRRAAAALGGVLLVSAAVVLALMLRRPPERATVGDAMRVPPVDSARPSLLPVPSLAAAPQLGEAPPAASEPVATSQAPDSPRRTSGKPAKPGSAAKPPLKAPDQISPRNPYD
jgi:eukaryotic-like serine/threonine-protein kinase